MLPEKALLLSQLTLTDPDFTKALSAQVAPAANPESTQTKSAHVVLPGSWVESTTGNTINGFYKPTTTSKDEKNNHPVLMGKCEVAIGVFMNMWLGKTAAEDRLVFDDSGQIVGTFSRKLPDYKPMASFEHPVPSGEIDELANPTTVEILIKQNVARLLTALWGIGNIDVNPYNISIKGEGSVLDYGQCLPLFMLIIEGSDGFLKRLEEVVVYKPQKLVGEDLNTLPILSEGHYRNHWPTNFVPGTLNLYKQFQSYETFRKLSVNSHLRVEIAPGKKVSFQEQMFESLLTMLLTYDPEMLRARLNDYLGDLPLDFMSLPEARKEALCKSDTVLFNERTDKAPFVKHMMTVFQHQYDELYRAVVFYQGFKLEDGPIAPVVSFIEFLRNRPSARKKTIAWAKEQNTLFSFSDAAKFNAETMEDRYAQIWRDAHVIQFWVLWHALIKLAKDVAKDLRIKPIPAVPDSLFKIEDNITETGQIIKPLMDQARDLDVSVDSDPDSNVTQGLKLLNEFIVKLTEASVKYFDSTRNLLNIQENDEYCEALLSLPKLYHKKICDAWSSTAWVGCFVGLVRELDSLHGNLRLDLHKFADDDALAAPVKLNYTALLNRSYKDQEVVNTFIGALFEWANAFDRDVLISLISQVKDLYEAKWFNCRYRGPEIAAYLKDLEKRKEVDGANILAYVLSTGECNKGSLNTSIIENILPLVLRWRRGFGGIDNVNLMSLDNALSGNAVDSVYYTQKIVDYVRTAEQFTHIYSPLSQMKFNRAMYSWVNKLSRERFAALVNQALNDHEPEYKPNASHATQWYAFLRTTVRTVKSYTVGGTVSRRPEVLDYLQDKDLSNSGVLGSIFHFKDGGIDEPTAVFGVPATERPFNLCLFDLIFAEMTKEVSASAAAGVRLDSALEIISKVDKLSSKHYPHFPSFKYYAKQYCQHTNDQLAPSQAAEQPTPLPTTPMLPMASSM